MTPCSPACPGFAVFNAPNDGSPIGGDIQRCDECATMTDAQARTLARAMGLKLDRKGIVTEALRLLSLLRLR
jgi:hypothetical protein